MTHKFKDPNYPFSHGEDYPLLGIKFPPEPNLFGEANFDEYDLYWIFYPCRKLSREVRKRLKDLGYICERHARTNKEIWTFDKVDWSEVNRIKEEMQLPENPLSYNRKKK